MGQCHKFLGSCTTQLCTEILKRRLIIFSMALLSWADLATHSWQALGSSRCQGFGAAAGREAHREDEACPDVHMDRW